MTARPTSTWPRWRFRTPTFSRAAFSRAAFTRAAFSRAAFTRSPFAAGGALDLRRRRVAIGVTLTVALAIVVALLLRACGPPGTITVVAVGDMACDALDPAQADPALGTSTDTCQAQRVSDAAVALRPDYLLGLGDYQYELPTAAAFRDIYGPSWGRLRQVTIPAIGNQEYKVHDANTFDDYFGDRAGDPRGYWSTDVGAWHVVVLNSNCTTVAGGCAAGSPQQRWLEQDLSRGPARCTVALMHHPRWSSGIAGPDERTGDLVGTLVDHRVELLLSGHESDYERFVPMDASGNADPAGITQFVVGVGGQAHAVPAVGDAPWRATGDLVSGAYFDGDHHGFLELTLRASGWDWAYHALNGSTAPVVDQGSGVCG